jgi:hypothetical protein
MLAFFFLEKAISEIACDLVKRPGGVGIAIRAVLAGPTKRQAGAGARSA